MPDKLSRLRKALLSHYDIERELGRGGAAIVHLAQDLRHSRLVALKVLRAEVASALGTDRFLREIGIAARLSHPHILPLYDSGEVEGFLYYVMPYVEGDSLEVRLANEGPLAVEESLRIAGEVAEALDYAHRHGIVHRDIKPGNVLFSDGHALITDFGFARALNEARGRLTPAGLVVGTPAYMSPEQARGWEDLDGRADIYSLGCMLFEMLTGEPPFTARTPQAVFARHVGETPSSIRVVRPEVSERVERAVMMALEKDRKDRPGSGEEFRKDLSD